MHLTCATCQLSHPPKRVATSFETNGLLFMRLISCATVQPCCFMRLISVSFHASNFLFFDALRFLRANTHCPHSQRLPPLTTTAPTVYTTTTALRKPQQLPRLRLRDSALYGRMQLHTVLGPQEHAHRLQGGRHSNREGARDRHEGGWVALQQHTN
jgi:hypothetical protein